MLMFNKVYKNKEFKSVMVKRKCKVCGKNKAEGYYNRHYKAFICDSCAEEQESKPYGRYCEECGCDTFTEKHMDGCGNE